MRNTRNILRISTVLALCFFSFLFTYDVNAKTISSSNSFIDTNTRDYFYDVYDRQSYSFSILSSEYVYNGTGYGSTTYYYLCLTNDKPDVSSMADVNASCDKLYRFHRDGSTYDFELLSDTNLTVSNSIYYFVDSKHFLHIAYLVIIAVLLGVLVFYLIFKDLF